MRQATDDLIRRLAASAEPVRPLRGPWLRAAAWLACSLLYTGVVVVVLAPRDDLATKMGDSRFLAEALTSLATGVAAAIAAFTTVVPGRGRKAIAVLLLPLSAWLWSLGWGCLQDWIQLGPQGRLLQTDWGCFPAILATGAPPTILMALMLRRGAPLTPTLSMALAGLAAASLADFGVRFHHHEPGVMVLVWHLAAVALLLAAASGSGRRVLTWATVTL